MKGTVTVDEMIFEIVDIKLEESSVLYIARRRGAILKSGKQVVNYVVHAPDGSLVSVGNTTVSWPETGEDEWCTIIFPIRNLSSFPGQKWVEPMEKIR